MVIIPLRDVNVIEKTKHQNDEKAMLFTLKNHKGSFLFSHSEDQDDDFLVQKLSELLQKTEHHRSTSM